MGFQTFLAPFLRVQYILSIANCKYVLFSLQIKMPKRINIITCWKYIQKKSEVNIEGIWYTEVIYRTHSLDTWHSMFQAHSK